MTVTLAGGGYRLALDPERGGAVLSADWSSVEGKTVPLLVPQTDSLPAFKGGCFAMLPFANRIAEGRFDFAGQTIELPVNHPSESMAIHGFGRDHPWKLTSAGEADAVLVQDFEQEGIPYRYHAEQRITLSEAGVRFDLAVRNAGPEVLPFGIGFHPWFARTPQTRLTFRAQGTFSRDERGLPAEPLQPVATFDADNPTPLGDAPWFDGCFAGWSPRAARLAWPERGAELEITADGALRLLHVYTPDDRDVVCVEPVSHLPDVINRPALAHYGAMEELAPGQTLSGAMILRARVST